MTQTTHSLWQRLSTWWHNRHRGPVVIHDGLWQQRLDATHYRLGLSNEARDQLGEISFIDIPVEVSDSLTVDDDILQVESDKAVQDFKTPLSGTITAINVLFLTDPLTINANQQSANWIIDIQID